MSNKAKEWIWIGYPGHFICADNCRFRLCTQVGNVLVSTVGDLHYGKSDERKTLGANEDSFFETYIFAVIGGGVCKDPTCLCGMPDVNFSEIEGHRTATAQAATAMHMKMCNKYANIRSKKRGSHEAGRD